jgi:protease-4
MDPENPSPEEDLPPVAKPDEPTPLRPEPTKTEEEPANAAQPPFPPPNYGQWQQMRARRPGRGCLFYFLLFFFLAVVALVTVAVALPAYLLSAGRGWTDEITGGEDTGMRESFVPGAGPQSSGRKIAVVQIRGMILSGGGRGVADATGIVAELDQARRDKQVVAVILDLNTPGGEVTASDEIHRAVLLCRREKPVVGCMRSLAASGGYYVAAGCDWIVANRHTLTGSVGVIMHSLNYADFLARWGLKVETIKSGAMKDMMSGSRPPTDAERQYMESLIQETFQGFAAVVAEGRPGFATTEDVLAADFADGRVLTGVTAKEAGLVDQIGYFDDAVDKAIELSGGGTAKLISYRRRSGLAEFILGLKSDHQLMENVVPAELRALRPGCLYALWPGALTGDGK